MVTTRRRGCPHQSEPCTQRHSEGPCVQGSTAVRCHRFLGPSELRRVIHLDLLIDIDIDRWWAVLVAGVIGCAAAPARRGERQGGGSECCSSWRHPRHHLLVGRGEHGRACPDRMDVIGRSPVTLETPPSSTAYEVRQRQGASYVRDVQADLRRRRKAETFRSAWPRSTTHKAGWEDCSPREARGARKPSAR